MVLRTRWTTRFCGLPRQLAGDSCVRLQTLQRLQTPSSNINDSWRDRAAVSNERSGIESDALKCDVRPQHVLSHIRDTLGRVECTTATYELFWGVPWFTQWVQLWTDRRLDAFTEPWLQAKVIGGDEGGQGETDRICRCSSNWSHHRSSSNFVWRAAGAHFCGIYHAGGAPEIAWNIHAKMAAEPTKVFIDCTSVTISNNVNAENFFRLKLLVSNDITSSSVLLCETAVSFLNIRERQPHLQISSGES